MAIDNFTIGIQPKESINKIKVELEADIAEEDRHDWFDATSSDSSDDNMPSGAFGFETDHAALKGNSDYDSLMRCLVILEAQRIKTVKDIEKLVYLKDKVKDNPNEFLTKLINGDTSEFPTSINVEQVPIIDWTKYSITNCKGDSPHAPTEESRNAEGSPLETNLKSMKVRGRVYDATKPQTFNQPWTVAEQMRFEELLIEYPSEKNENNRWKKISKALGNRTWKQVCSRAQKYFKKLNQVGLPIPGHQLKYRRIAANTKSFGRGKKRKQTNSTLRKKSTFFPTEYLAGNLLFDNSEDESPCVDSTLTPELKEEITKKVLEYKQKEAQLSSCIHPNIKCAICEEEPLSGTRWSCLECHTISLCSNCVISQLSALPPVHPPTHPLEPLINPSVAHFDPDYTHDSFKSNNYLDPNYVMPNVI